MHIFISYAKMDTRDLALRLRDRLVALPGVTAWMDDSLEAASSWAAQIQAEIDRADYLVVLLSPDVNRQPTPERSRSFVLNEIDYAQQINKQVVPVMAQATRMPVQLAGIQYIDLTRDADAGLERLIRHLLRDETSQPSSAPALAQRQRISPVIVFGAAIAVVIAFIGLIWVLRPPNNLGTTETLTPNFETQAAQLATDFALTAQVTVSPTLDSTEIIGTLVANIIASETAKAGGVLVDATATAQANLIEATRTLIAATDVRGTQTADVLRLTEQAATRVQQSTQAVPTNTPPPTATETSQPTATGTGTPTATPTVTRNPTEQAESAALAETQIIATASALYTEQFRVQIAAFNITAAFEGGSYDNFSYDGRDLTYGRFNFSLVNGVLEQVIDLYLEMATTDTATAIRNEYLERIQAQDLTLGEDVRFRELLIAAADESLMTYAQDQVVMDAYWNDVQEFTIAPRGITLPLSQAFLFDLAIQLGPNHNLFEQVEAQYGVAADWVADEDGHTEETSIRLLAEVYASQIYSLAERENLPGLRLRPDFWLERINAEDWQLRGDANGEVEPRPGVRIQVRDL